MPVRPPSRLYATKRLHMASAPGYILRRCRQGQWWGACLCRKVRQWACLSEGDHQRHGRPYGPRQGVGSCRLPGLSANWGT